MTPVDPILSDSETLLIIGLTKGANKVRINNVRVSLIFCIRASRPGILAIVAFIAFTMIVRKDKGTIVSTKNITDSISKFLWE
jgi:hypothetical protein